MLKFDFQTNTAIETCRKYGIPYALYAMPGEDAVNFFASDPRKSHARNKIDPAEFDSFDGFVFNFFEIDKTLHAYGIRREISADDVLSLDTTGLEIPEIKMTVPTTISTDRMLYYAQANNIISGMHTDEEKTVLAHVVSVESSISPVMLAQKYFRKHPLCFRYLYFTPESGTWLGASPELLVDFNRITGALTSMSLAGTRRYNGEMPWDNKNLLEHDIVTRYISEILSAFCKSVDTPAEAKVRFGDIEHLCHIIKADGRGIALADLLPELCPTPALCGWPRDKAYKLILENEAFQRHCYGGFVGINNKTCATLYVNLRCAMVDFSVDSCRFIYNLFSGGGLTRHSIPHEEWLEAKSKMRTLLSLINNYSY